MLLNKNRISVLDTPPDQVVDSLNIYDREDSVQTLGLHIATDKRGYPHDIFLISQRKHMLWVLIRSASVRRF